MQLSCPQRQVQASPATSPAAAPNPLCDDGAGGGALIPPSGRQDTHGLVVAGQAVDARLDQDEAELGVLVLPVALEVLPDGDGLLSSAA